MLFRNLDEKHIDPYTCIVIAVDKDGTERVLGVVDIKQGANSRFDYSLNKDEYVRFQYSVPDVEKASQISILISPASTSTNRAPDTINDYGTETPTQEDKQAIENLRNGN